MVVSLLEITTGRGSQKFYRPIDVHSATNAIDKIEVSMVCLAITFFLWLGCKQISDRMNKNHLDLILVRRNRDCCTMDNIRYLLGCEQNISIKLLNKV